MTVEQKAAVAVACLWAIVIAIALTCERRIARRELQIASNHPSYSQQSAIDIARESMMRSRRKRFVPDRDMDMIESQLLSMGFKLVEELAENPIRSVMEDFRSLAYLGSFAQRRTYPVCLTCDASVASDGNLIEDARRHACNFLLCSALSTMRISGTHMTFSTT